MTRLTTTLALAACLLLPAVAEAQNRRGRGRNRADTAPEVGDRAPDFDLPRLVDGAPDPEDRVRLSDFRGERPVVLVFGSYT
jgi:hypothetical protein